MRTAALAVLLGSVAIVLAGCGDDEPRPAGDAGDGATVTIDTFLFEPDPVEVEAGATVTWTNEDRILHTVTAGTRARPEPDFDHELDGAGATTSVTFEQPGEIRYFCSIHAGMDGRVLVR